MHPPISGCQPRLENLLTFGPGETLFTKRDIADSPADWGIRKRRLRAQMKQAREQRAGGKSLHEIAASLSQPRAMVKGWLESAIGKRCHKGLGREFDASWPTSALPRPT